MFGPKKKRVCMELTCLRVHLYVCACYINMWKCMLMCKEDVCACVVCEYSQTCVYMILCVLCICIDVCMLRLVLG